MKTLTAFLVTCLLTVSASGQNPSANFTSNVTSGCSPLTVAFTDQSTGSPIAWSWEFSNGTLSTARNPVVTFSQPGTYSAKLVVRNATGIDQIEKIDYITVLPSPVANFSSNVTLGCVPVTVNFFDQSSPQGSIISWEWNFGDGTTSIEQNPSHTYTVTGFYSVTLTVTGSNGCRRTVTRGSYIRIVGSIDADFTYSQPSSCQPPFVVHFQNQSSGPGTISYNWDLGNGQTSTAQNPSATYSSPGTYTVRLHGQSSLGCSGSIEKTITISSTTTDFTAPAIACTNQPVRFQNNSSSPPLSSFWQFGDGTTSAQINPLKTYLTAGTYTVKLINRYANCTDSIEHSITVANRPAVNFMADDSSSCVAPFNVQFTALAPDAVSWFWDFGDGNTSTLQNPAHQYTNPGRYSVSLTISVSAGCSNTIVIPDFIRIQQPTVSINLPTGGCIPFTYAPEATIESPDPIATYLWNLGEPGATFTMETPPPYTYTSEGAYTVSLTVTTVTGCTVTASVANGIRTGVPPVVDFSFTPADECASEVIRFTDLSVTTPDALVEWLWDFGDGGTSSLQNPQQTFRDTGDITVRLVVSNNRCLNSTEKVVHVRPPVARFRYVVNCANNQVTFVNTSLADPALVPLTYLWEMGDPAHSQFTTPTPPVFSYPGPGSYTVSLTVQNGACSYRTRETVTIADEEADFSINRDPVCKGETFMLSAINSDPDNISSYAWVIDGTVFPNAGRTINHRIATPGSYAVSLTIRDINGCQSTKNVDDFIHVSGPAAMFTPPASICLGTAATFTDQSMPAGSITKWHFNFGDNTQQDFSAPPFTHTYTQPGGYTPSLTVTDALGCTDTYTLPRPIIIANLKVGFRSETFYCPAAPLLFADTSEGAGLSYLWTFGDGNTSTLQNPTHSYPVGDADYTVTLQVRDVSGCEAFISKPGYIKIRSPKAALDIKDTISICPPLRTVFTFKGTDYQSFYWNFGDGQTSTQQDPVHFYGNYGHYVSTLYVQGPGGCIDSAKASATVYNPQTYTRINYSPTRACNSLLVNFDLVVPPEFRFIFYFGDGSQSTSRETSFSHFYSRPSFNSPYLTIFDSISGCQVSISGSRRIDVLGAIPLFGKNRSAFCDNGEVAFQDFTVKNEPIISTLWNFGDGSTSTDTDPVHTFTAPGLYPVVLSVTTQSNCTSTYRDTIFVYRTPNPAITGRDTICLNIAEPFSGSIAVADTLTNWQWDFQNGQTSNQQHTTATYTTAGGYTIRLTASNKLGCGNTATKAIYAAPLPTATPVEDPVTILSGGSGSLLMNYTGNIVSYNWSPATRLSCTTCPQPVANPQFTTEYTVRVEDIYGCRNSGEVTVAVVCNNQNFFIPNTFSPNGDGQNDVFFPRGTGLFRIKSMTIFNRWGQIVFDRKDFTANNPAAGWTGTFQGQKASADVYVYMMEILCDNNTVVPVKGNVTLLR